MFQKKNLEKVEKEDWRLEGIITCWPVGFKFMGFLSPFQMSGAGPPLCCRGGINSGHISVADKGPAAVQDSSEKTEKQ